MAEERVQRRLAAILAADVVGYSRLMEQDETGTLSRVRALRRELFEPRTREHGGRIFKTTGDGALVEFKSAVDAVKSATEIQQGLALRNQDEPDQQRIELRIGISLGDVIVEGNDLFGNGVNVAARMEGLAEPGGICISGNVQEHIGRSLEFSLEDLGEQAVKNIDRPVRCYRIRLEPVASAEPSLPLPAKPSIAVLPFDNISGDPEQEYFADGITEDIITELSKISGLFVIARHSAFTYKGKSVTLKQVGRELGVRYVLEGSVRKAADRLRITGQLIDAETDHHVWAERYDRDLEDIFAVQDEVAREVANALAVALRPGEGERLAHVPTRNIEAYDLYMRSRMMAWPPTLGNIVAAREAYNRIMEIDSNFAGGHAGASITYSLAVRFGHSEREEEDATVAMALAERAMALDDQFALSHSALGFALAGSGRYEEAVAAAQRAVDLQPGDTDGYMYLSQVLMSAGRGEEAREAVLTALRLDPQYVRGPYFNALGRACFMAGRYEEAVEAYERNRSGGGPIAVPMLSAWVASLGLLGRINEAREKAQELLRYAPGYTISDAYKTWRFRNPDDLNRLIEGLRNAGLPE